MSDKSLNELNTFLRKASPEYEESIRKLYHVVMSTSDRLQAAIKWNMLTFAFDGDFHHWICAVSPTKKNVSLVFHFGGLLQDEDNLLTKGSSKFFRKLVIDGSHGVNETTVRGLVHQAIDKLSYFEENWKRLNQEE